MVESGRHGSVVGERHHEPELFHDGVFGVGVRLEFKADGSDHDFRDLDRERGDGELWSLMWGVLRARICGVADLKGGVGRLGLVRDVGSGDGAETGLDFAL